MEESLKMEVISTEIIKPSSPTPSNLHKLSLSHFDKMYPLVYTHMLLFYSATTAHPVTQELHINGLKNSLSYTLSQFYPLAGRCTDESTVTCTDEGVPFTETHITNYPMSAIVSLPQPHKSELLYELLPPRPIDTVVPLMIQVNVFSCGGIVIGYYALHKLVDAVSLATFFRYWASASQVASKCSANLVKPDFHAAVEAFPPNPNSVQPMPLKSTDNSNISGHCGPNTLVKSFTFSNAAISRLKAKAASEQTPGSYFFGSTRSFCWDPGGSSVTTLAFTLSTAANNSLKWRPWEEALQAAIAASATTFEKITTTTFYFTADMRSRVTPPLPRGSLGNLVAPGKAQGEKQAQLQERVAEIHAAVLRVKASVVTLEPPGSQQKERVDPKKYEPGVYKLTSLCKIGFHEADFGFGNPKWIILTEGVLSPSNRRNATILTDHFDVTTGDIDGIEAWLFLEEKEMHILQSNPSFLAFATPNY
ncbi:stemmadenine O-acetyltransferase [Beta vulgaris subsp. vulgaris]|uniref:stemmadenine O-acetyltransferase n=1 Tax=Beta vulgaris subsp. vulgaris TaxID=3555 RepID=UPI00203748F7|nr:stemmadenine O-acetyltransferase [Beta vulgaris subsp. vulgaris]